jgi:hypothetical protein
MSYAIECQNCSHSFNPNNHYLCPNCNFRPDLEAIRTPLRSKPIRKYRSIGALGWYLVLFVFSGIIGGLLVMNESQDTLNPNTGYDAEWNVDNSIDGPTGTFDDQSKP